MQSKSQHKDYLIVANGPMYAKSIITEIAANKTIVALDGAATKLAKLGIMPNVIIGDFDSIENKEMWGITATFEHLQEDDKPYLGKYGVLIVPIKNQNMTDLTKGIRYCDGEKAESIHIISTISGSRIDHAIGSLRSLRANYRRNRAIFLHTESHTLTFACYETVYIRGKPKDNCGIISFPSAIFSSSGLKYNGQRYPLNFGFSESTCNELTTSTAEIQIQGEALIIHPGHFSSQKKFAVAADIAKLHQLYQESNWHLLELTVKEFKEIRKLRQQVKSIAGIKVYNEFSDTLKKTDSSDLHLSKMIYVSSTKQYLLNYANDKEKILLSMTPEKLYTFNFFKSHLDKREITPAALHDIAIELYSQGEGKIISRL